LPPSDSGAIRFSAGNIASRLDLVLDAILSERGVLHHGWVILVVFFFFVAGALLLQC
jgi:hypothetical protein